MAGLSAVTSLAGAAASASGQKQAAEAEARQLEYNSQVARINARTERQKGVAEQEKIADKYERQEGQAIAAAGKSGVDPLFGSAALVIFGEGGTNRESDVATSVVNAEAAATANINKAKDLEAQAAAKRQAGQIAAQGTFLSGLGGAVGGLGGAIGKSGLFINATV
jgi:hypothetical protein